MGISFSFSTLSSIVADSASTSSSLIRFSGGRVDWEIKKNNHKNDIRCQKKQTNFLFFVGFLTDSSGQFCSSFLFFVGTVLYWAGAPRSLRALAARLVARHRVGTQASFDGRST